MYRRKKWHNIYMKTQESGKGNNLCERMRKLER